METNLTWINFKTRTVEQKQKTDNTDFQFKPPVVPENTSTSQLINVK